MSGLHGEVGKRQSQKGTKENLKHENLFREKFFRRRRKLSQKVSLFNINKFSLHRRHLLLFVVSYTLSWPLPLPGALTL